MKKVVTRVFSQMTRHASTHPHPGIDRRGSPPTRILVKYGDMEMWSQPGGTYNNRGKHYVHGQVVLFDSAEDEWQMVNWPKVRRVILNRHNSRVSKKMIAEWAAQIDEFFGVPVAHLIDAKLTVYVEDEGRHKRVSKQVVKESE